MLLAYINCWPPLAPLIVDGDHAFNARINDTTLTDSFMSAAEHNGNGMQDFLTESWFVPCVNRDQLASFAHNANVGEFLLYDDRFADLDQIVTTVDDVDDDCDDCDDLNQLNDNDLDHSTNLNHNAFPVDHHRLCLIFKILIITNNADYATVTVRTVRIQRRTPRPHFDDSWIALEYDVDSHDASNAVVVCEARTVRQLVLDVVRGACADNVNATTNGAVVISPTPARLSDLRLLYVSTLRNVLRPLVRRRAAPILALLLAGLRRRIGCGVVSDEQHVSLFTDADDHADDDSSSELTPLGLAAQIDAAAIVRLLLRHGAPPHLGDVGNDPATPLFLAARAGALRAMAVLLARSDVNINALSRGRTALSAAVTAERDDAVVALLRAGARLDIGDSITPLQAAASLGNAAIARRLLNAGAGVDHVAAGNAADGATPLMAAAAGGHVDVVRLLLGRGARRDAASTSKGATALWLAAQRGHVGVVAALLQNADASYASTARRTGESALYVAAECGHSAVVRQLLAGGAAIDAASERGTTALFGALRSGHVDVVVQLLRAGASTTLVDGKGATALLYAARHLTRRTDDVVALLIAAGAELDARLPDGAKESALTIALLGHKTAMARSCAMAGAAATDEQLVAIGAISNAERQAFADAMGRAHTQLASSPTDAVLTTAPAAATTTTPPAPPEVRRFQSSELTFVRVLGKGSFGEVHLCWAQGTKVAVKVVRNATGVAGAVASEREAVAALESEVRQMALLRVHPNVVSLYGIVDQGDGKMAAVVEYCGGGALHSALYGGDAAEAAAVEWTLELQMRVATQAANGVAFLHEMNVVHRDIAARNVFLSDDGDKSFSVKVGDFGLSRNVVSRLDSRRTVGSVGNFAWLSPEAMQGTYSTASDVFAFAVLLYEIFARKAPWSDRAPVVALQAVLVDDARLEVPIGAPTIVGEMMRRCWLKDVAARPTMVDMQGACRTLGGSDYENLKFENLKF